MGKKDYRDIRRLDGFPLGVNNTAREHSLPHDELGRQVALREGENIDVSADGKARRRGGYVQVLAGTRMHSGWSGEYFDFGLLVDDDALCAVRHGSPAEVLVAGLAAGRPVSYAAINDSVCWTNGVQCGQVTAEGVARPWACENPPTVPTATAVTGGALDAGEYQVALTFVDAWGRESGATMAAPVTVAANGGIALEGLPQPPAGGRTRIYMSNGNDGVLRGAAALPPGPSTFLLAQRAEGPECRTRRLQPLPPGQLVAYGNGRQYVAQGREVLFSPSLRYGLYDPRSARVGFVQRVDRLDYVEGDGGGLYVSDGKRTYFLPGADPADWAQRIAYRCGAVPGQLAWAPGDVWGLDTKQPLPVWQARDGRLCVGLPGGKVFTPQARDSAVDVAFDTAERAALMFRVEEGDRRVVASLRGSQANAFAVKDQMIVREYRHE